MRQAPTARRPRYLVIALALVWLVGFVGSLEGCEVIEVLRHPDHVRAAASAHPEPLRARAAEAMIDAIVSTRRVAAPLAAGELILASLLMLSAALTLFGRGKARKLLVQAMVAYGLFLPVDYIARRPVRAARIEAAAVAPDLPTVAGVDAAEVPELLRRLGWSMARGALAFQFAVLGLGCFAMTRPRVREFYAATGPTDMRNGGP